MAKYPLLSRCLHSNYTSSNSVPDLSESSSCSLSSMSSSSTESSGRSRDSVKVYDLFLDAKPRKMLGSRAKVSAFLQELDSFDSSTITFAYVHGDFLRYLSASQQKQLFECLPNLEELQVESICPEVLSCLLGGTGACHITLL